MRQYNSEEENSVDIEFHDTSIHHAMHITNNHNYTLAALSTEAVLLASEGDSENGRLVYSRGMDACRGGKSVNSVFLCHVMGSKFFYFRIDDFQKGFAVQENKQEVS